MSFAAAKKESKVKKPSVKKALTGGNRGKFNWALKSGHEKASTQDGTMWPPGGDVQLVVH